MTIRVSETPDATRNRSLLTSTVRSCHAVRSRSMRRSSDSISENRGAQVGTEAGLIQRPEGLSDTLGIAGHRGIDLGSDAVQDRIGLPINQAPDLHHVPSLGRTIGYQVFQLSFALLRLAQRFLAMRPIESAGRRGESAGGVLRVLGSQRKFIQPLDHLVGVRDLASALLPLDGLHDSGETNAKQQRESGAESGFDFGSSRQTTIFEALVPVVQVIIGVCRVTNNR